MPQSMLAINAPYMLSLNGSDKVAGMGSGGIESTWTSYFSLEYHFGKHGKQFDSKSVQDYARKAHELYHNRMEYQYKVGVTRVYDAKTNTFGSYNAKGKTITFFKPTDCQKYFDRQPGK